MKNIKLGGNFVKNCPKNVFSGANSISRVASSISRVGSSVKKVLKLWLNWGVSCGVYCETGEIRVFSMEIAPLWRLLI